MILRIPRVLESVKVDNVNSIVILRKVGEVHIFKHRLYVSALQQTTVSILGKYVLLGVINTIYKHCYA